MTEKFRLESLVVGPIQTNCYLLQNNENNKMIIVDPGDDAGKIKQMINKMGGTPQAIFLTHSHLDHLMAVRELKADYPGLWLVLLDKEEPLFRVQTYVMPGVPADIAGEPDVWVKEGDVLNLIGTDIKVMHTPGHSCGSACYYLEELGIIFTGDTLFEESCGRVDFPTGSGSDMKASLERILKEIPDNTIVYPGHMGFTMIEHEKRYNPYI